MERVLFHRSPEIAGVELMSVSGSLSQWRMYHERYAMCACESAYSRWIYRGRDRLAVDGSTAFVEPGETHASLGPPLKRSDMHIVFIDTRVVQRMVDEIGGRLPHFPTAQTEDPRVFRAVCAFAKALRARRRILELQSRFAMLLMALGGLAESPPTSEKAVDPRALLRARAHLIERYNQPVTLHELAKVAGVSRFHLVRAFRHKYGMPPHAFQVHVRVERAAALLRRGTLPVDAAASVGFADQSHLNRHFGRIIRTTPASYLHA